MQLFRVIDLFAAADDIVESTSITKEVEHPAWVTTFGKWAGVGKKAIRRDTSEPGWFASAQSSRRRADLSTLLVLAINHMIVLRHLYIRRRRGAISAMRSARKRRDDAPQQISFCDGLSEKADRSGGQRPLTFVGEGRDDYDGKARVQNRQTLQEF